MKKKERVESNPLIQQTAYFAGRRKTGVDEESDDDLASVTFKADYNTVRCVVYFCVIPENVSCYIRSSCTRFSLMY